MLGFCAVFSSKDDDGSPTATQNDLPDNLGTPTASNSCTTRAITSIRRTSGKKRRGCEYPTDS